MTRRVILNFHGIGAPRRELEPGEDRYWISQAFYAEVLDLCHRLRDQVSVSFTFDDGNLSDLTIGAEEMRPYGVTAQIFVLAGRLDAPGALSRADIETLVGMGHQIGLHGADHVDWRRLDAAGQTREYDTARAEIAAAAGQPVTAAAIPFGAYDRSVLTALRQRGFERVYSSDGGAWRDGQFPLPRTSLRNDMTLSDVEDALLGREPSSRRIRRRLAMTKKRWL